MTGSGPHYPAPKVVLVLDLHLSLSLNFVFEFEFELSLRSLLCCAVLTVLAMLPTLITMVIKYLD